MKFIIHGKLFWLFPILTWGALAMLSVQWNLRGLDGIAESLAYERAQSMFKLVQMTRLWNAQHGGVYVPLSKTTPSNPYLEDPAKDAAAAVWFEYFAQPLVELVHAPAGGGLSDHFDETLADTDPPPDARR